MRRTEHLTPTYLWDRLSSMLHQWHHPDRPWLTRSMVDILASWLQPEDIGLEFGSGRSTPWFASRVGHLTSVEHDADWYERVSQRLGAAGNVSYNLHTDGAAGGALSRYVSVARDMAPASLDFVLVDGVARDHCAEASLDKIKPGGVLIIDNANWYLPREPTSRSPDSRGLAQGYESEVWRDVGRRLQEWRCVWTTNGVTDTALWVKNASLSAKEVVSH